MLNSHPNIAWKSELFHPLHENTISIEDGDEPFSLLTGPLGDCRSRVFGFETKFQHLDENGLNVGLNEYLEGLQQLGFNKFILLERKNYLRQAISVARGQLTKTWHVSYSDEKPEFPVFELDVSKVGLGGHNRQLIDCFEFLQDSYENAEQALRSMKNDFLRLSYEDDLELNAGMGLKKTLSFLGVKQIEPSFSLRRLDSRPVSQMISNWKQVFEQLRGTPFEWMCESGHDDSFEAR